jgi:hypothetical protein
MKYAIKIQLENFSRVVKYLLKKKTNFYFEDVILKKKCKQKNYGISILMQILKKS